jgi:hypothetical protein
VRLNQLSEASNANNNNQTNTNIYYSYDEFLLDLNTQYRMVQQDRPRVLSSVVTLHSSPQGFWRHPSSDAGRAMKIPPGASGLAQDGGGRR